MAAKGEREVRVRFTGESAVLKGAAGDVRKAFLMMQSDINDTRSASEKLAAAQKQVAASMKKDMEAIAAAADVVRDSLGPEMTAAIESSGRSVEDQVQEWRKLGLTLDEIKMDSGQLADGMKQLDDAARQSAGQVGDGFRKISAAADNSRSVVANFTGNLASELPGVSGAFGPLNMAIGQFAEYATEGNISMKNFLTAAGGMAVATIGFQLLSSAISAMGADQREMNARTDEVVDAFAQQIAKSYELATATGVAGGKVDGLAAAQRALSQALVLAGDDGAKLREALGALGLTSDDAAAAIIEMQQSPLTALKKLAEQAGFTGDEAERMAQQVADSDSLFLGTSQANRGLTEAMKQTMIQMEELQDQAEKTDLQDITQEFLNNQAAASDAAGEMVRLAEANLELSRNDDAVAVYQEFNRLLGEADAITRDAVLGTHEHADALRVQEDALRAEEDAQRAATEAAAEAEQAVRDLMSAQMASIDSTYAVRDAQDQFTTSMEELAVAIDDPTTGVDELRQAQDNATQSALASALAVQANAEALAAASGAPLTAAESNQVLIDSLYATALSLDENSPVRAALVSHIGTLQNVPGQVSTTVVANVGDAKDRIGEVQTAVDDLGDTSAEAETDAETQTALDKVTTLTGAVDDLDGRQITLGVVLTGDEDTKTRLAALRTSLQLTIDKANEADRAVARVAG